MSKDKYSIILADPPWHFKNFKEAAHGAAVSAYPVMKDKDVVNLPIGDIAEKNSLVFLWCTWPKIEIGFECLKSWGFKYITGPFVWSKVNKDASQYCGLGFYSRSSTEFVLMGKRGKGVSRAKGATNIRQGLLEEVDETFFDQIKRHSAKPPAIRDRISELFGPDVSKIELFAREQTSGWKATGLDLDGIDIRDFLKNENKIERD